jgi:hypothetical protein
MPDTVEAPTGTEREPDAETPAEKSAVTLNYEEMLAALNGLLAEMQEERRQAEASGYPVEPSKTKSQRPPKPTCGPKLTPRSPRNSHGCPPTRRTAPAGRTCAPERNAFPEKLGEKRAQALHANPPRGWFHRPMHEARGPVRQMSIQPLKFGIKIRTVIHNPLRLSRSHSQPDHEPQGNLPNRPSMGNTPPGWTFVINQMKAAPGRSRSRATRVDRLPL